MISLEPMRPLELEVRSTSPYGCSGDGGLLNRTEFILRVDGGLEVNAK